MMAVVMAEAAVAIETRAGLYTIAPGLPFLDTLARAILLGHLPHQGGAPPDPITLSRYTLLLPTRRAARALAQSFLTASGGQAMLLPRVKPISEGEDDLSLMLAGAGLGGPDAIAIPPAIEPIERRLLLTRLVQRWSEARREARCIAFDSAAMPGAEAPAQALKLADELAALMDLIETEGVDLGSITKLVPEEYAAHWAESAEFLKIAFAIWPEVLSESGRISPAERRNRLLRAEAARLRTITPEGPVIVAGVTGSIPATVEVMRAVLSLGDGALVLPGFDTSLTPASFALVSDSAPEHPQHGLARLIQALGVDPVSVRELSNGALSSGKASRRRLVIEAMLPAQETGRWHDLISAAGFDDIRAALADVSLVTAPTAQDEAEAVSLILRKVIEAPGKTAALVSPDRNLARRVAARLETLGIVIDDSAGRPLAKTPSGAFLDLVISAFAEDFAPKALMTLLKHPLLRLSLPVPVVRRAARALEVIAFRTLYLGRGLEGVSAALDAARSEIAEKRRRERALLRLWDPDWEAARDLVVRLDVAYRPLAELVTRSEPVTLTAWASAHAAVADHLARTGATTHEDQRAVTPATPEISPVWHEEAGSEATKFFQSLALTEKVAPTMSARDYPEFYRGLVAGINVRPSGPVHPRISIWGPFEARLQQPDVVILGSLNDGTWPEAADPGAWLNRPMRARLGLPSPEATIGQSAHDFISQLGADQVFLTRAEKIDGEPKVPSRWLLRLLALADGAGRADGVSGAELLRPAEPWLEWARARDDAPRPAAALPPAPKPALALRPRQLPVTAIERWLANPYAIYARYVLKLESLPMLGVDPGAALRGQIIHEALGRFALRYPTELPEDIAGELIAAANETMSAYAAHPRVAAFWLPRFERFARWFADTEPARRPNVAIVDAEVEGFEMIEAPGGPFKLKARADRIDTTEAGLVITDYKTGKPPSATRIVNGLAPQLPLEAVIAFNGGFTGINAGQVAALRYIRVSGGSEPGAEIDLELKNETILELATRVRSRLASLVADFDDPSTPYQAVRRAAFASAYSFDDYAHLARVDEWAGVDAPEPSDEESE